MVEAWWWPDGPTTLSSDDEIDAMIDAMIAAGLDHSVASLTFPDQGRLPSGLPDHELRIAALGSVGGVQYDGIVDYESGQWYVPGANGDRTPVEYRHLGKAEQWPADSIISVDVVRDVVKSFLKTRGGRPEAPDWFAWS